MGLLPDQYYDLTISEIEYYWHGYQVRQAKEWERTRLLAWIHASAYRKTPISQYEFMPLMTDPSEDEMKLIEAEKKKEHENALNKMYEYYNSLGYKV